MGKGLEKLGIFAIKHRTNKLGDEDLGKFSAGDVLLCRDTRGVTTDLHDTE